MWDFFDGLAEIGNTGKYCGVENLNAFEYGMSLMAGTVISLLVIASVLGISSILILVSCCIVIRYPLALIATLLAISLFFGIGYIRKRFGKI